MRIKHCEIYICVVSLIDFVITKQEKQLKKGAKCKVCMDVKSSFFMI